MFPIINTLADVLPAIEGLDEILVADRGTHTVVNYLVVKPDTFPPLNVAGGSAKMRAERSLHYAIRRECRGMIFAPDGRIIRRPLHKFFNINEREETLAKNIDFSRPHDLLTKLDGSSISPCVISKELRYGTRMGPTDIGDQAHRFANENDSYIHFWNFCESYGYTPVYEWQSRQQRIVVDHPEDRLDLLAVRNMITGEYFTYDYLQAWEDEMGIPIVKPLNVPGATAAELVENVRTLPLAEYGEGVVVRFRDTGDMYKAKSDEYCIIHRAKERILEERYVVEDIINGNIDDVMATVLEDDRKNVERYIGKFWEALGFFQAKVMETIKTRHRQYPNRKDYAMSPENKLDSKFVTQATFWFYDTPLLLPTLRSYIIEKRVRPGLSTRTKFGEMKNEAIPNIVFKY